MAHQVNCTACQTTITGDEQRRLHYRSDIHLVNLKRKVAGLGPLTSSEFESRLEVLQQLKSSSAEGDDKKRRRGPRQKFVCDICHKTFSSQQALRNHENSRRHIDTLNARSANVSVISEDVNPDSHSPNPGQSSVGFHDDNSLPSGDEMTDDARHDVEIDDDDEDVDEELDARMKVWEEEGSGQRSAFDGAQFSTANAALQYMQTEFGLFTPYLERLKDKEGLVRYLSQKVCIGYACIACDKGFSSIDDVRKHMRDSGHCRFPSDDDGFIEEFAEFYDWGNSAEDKVVNAADDDEDGWEEVDSASDADAILRDVEILRDAAPGQVVVVDSAAKTRLLENVATEPPIGRLNDGTEDDGGEEAYALVLGDKVIGHRSLARYYRQSGGDHVDSRDAVVAHRKGCSSHELAAIQMKRRSPAFDKLSGSKHVHLQRQRFELKVGGKNYYVRKSKLKQKMGILNSGYRA